MLKKHDILFSIKSCWDWMEKNEFSSYDHYDFLATKYGVKAKSLFKNNHVLGKVYIAPLMVADILFPSLRQIIAEKKRSCEAIPLVILAAFKMYSLTNDAKYQTTAFALIKWLEEQFVTTPHGIGLGLQFDWQSEVFLPKNTPCVTITGLAAEVFYYLYGETKEEKYLHYLSGMCNFVLNDLQKNERNGKRIYSYSPIDSRFVINANSFAAAMMVYYLWNYHDEEVLQYLQEVTGYILQEQNEDGSWFYYDKKQVKNQNNFIDSFHTCFILENLYKIWQLKHDELIIQSIKKGLNYFVQQFISQDGAVSLYSKYPYFTGITVDIRACAEAISCLVMLKDVFPPALALALKIAEYSINKLQNKDGSFAFRNYSFVKNTMPYMRWGQAPMFKALSLLYEFV